MGAPIQQHPLRVERERRNWSQARVAEAIGISTRTVIRWEQGKGLPQFFYRERLCELFGKNALELGIQSLPETPAPPKGHILIQTFAPPTEKTTYDAFANNPSLGREQRQMYDPLLTTKFLVPMLMHTLVRRTRLTDLLTDGTRRALTLLSAPAGSGKTTLIAEWLEFFPPSVPPAWVSLDEEDNDPARFWLYLLTALDARQPGCYTSLIHILCTQQISSWSIFLKYLLNALLQSSQPICLVLDDYHVITEQTIHDAMAYFLKHLPPHVHLIISTRSDPPWSLSRLRTRGQLQEIRMDQLGGTFEEIYTFFFQTIQLKLTSTMTSEVVARTEGWMAGIQLLALSLRGNTNVAALLDMLHGDQRDFFDYLMEEVVTRQSPAVQDFLLQTSILTRLNAAYCDAVIDGPGSQEILELLEHANLFIISLDQQRHWYRYHHLFAQALRSLLARTYSSDQIRALHRRASLWLSQHGTRREMIPHALSAQEWDLAIEAIHVDTTDYSSFHRMWNSQHTILQRWIEQLPADILRQHPQLCLRYAVLLTWHAHTAKYEYWLNEAEKTLLAQDATSPALLTSETEPRKKLLGEIINLRALSAMLRGEGQKTLAFCQQAERYFEAQDFFLRAQNNFNFALAYYLCDQAVLAIPRLQEAMQLAEAAGDVAIRDMIGRNIILYLSLLGHLKQAWSVGQELFSSQEPLLFTSLSRPDSYQADILREWNDLDTALHLVKRAIGQAEKLEKLMILPQWYAVLAHCLFARGNLDAMEQVLRRAELLIDRLQNPLRYGADITVLRIRLWIARGDLEQANHWAHDYRKQNNEPSLMASAVKDIAYIRVLIANAEYQEAQQSLDQALHRAQTAQRRTHMIELTILQALIYRAMHAEQSAYASLSQALDLAQAEGYVRIFVDEGMPIAKLLTTLKQQKHAQSAYIDTLLAAFPAM